MTKTIISWDLGATKCLAGLITYNEAQGNIACQTNFQVKLRDAESLEDLVHQIESGLKCQMTDADAICIGAAGQYDGQHLQLENPYPYSMHFARLAKQKRWPKFDVIHDYAPIVCATFTSYMDEASNIKRLNTCALNPHGRRVALGIGTGLGIKDGVFLPNGDFWLGRNEMGHIGISLPPLADPYYQERHDALVRYLQTQHLLAPNQAITFEKILSGQGTVRLYEFLYPNDEVMTPESVGKKMRAGDVPELMDMFAWYLGLFVGTVQLTFMPEGGVWITGGVALNHLEVFDRPELHAGIHASPAYHVQRELYPLGVLCNHEHALIGGGYYAVKRLLT